MLGKPATVLGASSSMMEPGSSARPIIVSLATMGSNRSSPSSGGVVVLPSKPGHHALGNWKCVGCSKVFRTKAERAIHIRNCSRWPEARRRIRQETMKKLWSDPVKRERLLDGARTSKPLSPERQKAGAERLRRWRKANPEKFRAIQLLAMQKSRESDRTKSKIEDSISKLVPFAEGRRRFIKIGEKNFEIDILVTRKFLIEVDGLHHFRPIFGEPRFLQTKERDLILETDVRNLGNVCLLRIGLDSFMTSGRPRPEYQKAIELRIGDPKPGIWYFGKLWESMISERMTLSISK